MLFQTQIRLFFLRKCWTTKDAQKIFDNALLKRIFDKILSRYSTFVIKFDKGNLSLPTHQMGKLKSWSQRFTDTKLAAGLLQSNSFNG